MAYIFTDGFDCYAASADAIAGYWDSNVGAIGQIALGAGRFSGSQSVQFSANTAYVKSSGASDAVHHFFCGFQQTATITGSTLGMYFQLFDGTTAQCSVVFRSDGAILLVNGAPTGTVQATYTGAFPAVNTWYAFEIEVIISNTAGRMRVRKNGNVVDDYDSGATFDTQNSANAYANKLQFGAQSNISAQFTDDLLWRSDSVANGVSWIGDVRCQTRRPASDASVQWSPSSPALPYIPFAFNANAAPNTTIARYTPFTPPVSGAIGTVGINAGGVNAGNTKCSIFSAFGAAPGTPLGSATPLSNTPAGANTFTFGTPVSVTAGTQYYVGFMTDTAAASFYPTSVGVTQGQQQASTSYAAFPPTNPSTSTATAVICTINISPTGNPNAAMVQEPQQDAANSYVYSSTVGQSDLYGISSIATTPASIVAVTTRAFLQKSDAGTRLAAVQLKSGSVTAGGATVGPPIWNAADLTATTLSGGNLTATATGAGGVRSNVSVSTGKWYWETTWASGTGPGTGVANASAVLSTVWNTPTNAALAYSNSIYVNGASVVAGVSLFVGNTVCIALDMTNKRIWFRHGVGATWNNSGTADPATNVGGLDVTVLGTPLFALVAAAGGSPQWVANFGPTGFLGAVPSGFTAGLPSSIAGGVALNTVWNWIARTDTVDPATGAAWTAVGVNNAQVGVVVTA